MRIHPRWNAAICLPNAISGQAKIGKYFSRTHHRVVETLQWQRKHRRELKGSRGILLRVLRLLLFKTRIPAPSRVPVNEHARRGKATEGNEGNEDPSKGSPNRFNPVTESSPCQSASTDPNTVTKSSLRFLCYLLFKVPAPAPSRVPVDEQPRRGKATEGNEGNEEHSEGSPNRCNPATQFRSLACRVHQSKNSHQLVPSFPSLASVQSPSACTLLCASRRTPSEGKSYRRQRRKRRPCERFTQSV